MKITKARVFVLFSILAMSLAGCVGSKPNPEPTPGPSTKKDVSISIALEDGKQFNENSFVAPEVTVTPSSLVPTITYYQGETSLGTSVPQTVGDYKITATTAETDEYNAGLASKSFLIRKVPTLSFFYGNDQALEAGHQFDLAAGDYNIYAKSSVEGANLSYSYSNNAGEALQAKPNTAGVYYITASVARTSTIGSTEKTISFELIDSSSGIVAVDPTIKFFYDGEEKCLESNWLDGGFAQSHYDAENFDINKLTYTVTPKGASVSEEWSLKALDAPEEAEGSVIAKPSNPLAPGIYTVRVDVAENAYAHAGFRWAGFVINDNGSQTGPATPVIKFFYDGEEKCLETNWLNTGYADTQYSADEFDITKFSFAVEPDGASYSTAWTLNEQPIAEPSNPLAPGTYAFTVTVTANDVAKAGVKWALFAIKESSTSKVDANIKFFYDGTEKCLESNWLNSGYADSQYFANEFDVTKLTYTCAEGAEEVVSWTLDEVAIGAPSNPLAAGTYSMTVTVAGNDAVNAGVRWALFVIKAAAPSKVDANIKFFYDGAEKCLESNWLNSGYADSQYFADEFDVTKLSYTCAEGAEEVVSWTLDEVAIAAPTNPLAAGTYAMTVTVAGNDAVNAGVKWALFVIKASAPSKVDANIKFFYDGAEKCLESNWLNSGFADSQFLASEFDVTKLTYTCAEGAEEVVSWTLDEVAIAAPSNPLAAGTYAMTVTVAGNDAVNAGVRWALFAIVEPAPETLKVGLYNKFISDDNITALKTGLTAALTDITVEYTELGTGNVKTAFAARAEGTQILLGFNGDSDNVMANAGYAKYDEQAYNYGTDTVRRLWILESARESSEVVAAYNYLYKNWVEKEYFIIGTMNEWNTASKDYKLVKADENHYSFNGLDLAAGAQFKVFCPQLEGDARWFSDESTWADCGFTLSDSDKNVVVTEAGKYNIHFYVTSEYNNHIVIEKAANKFYVGLYNRYITTNIDNLKTGVETALNAAGVEDVEFTLLGGSGVNVATAFGARVSGTTILLGFNGDSNNVMANAGYAKYSDQSYTYGSDTSRKLWILESARTSDAVVAVFNYLEANWK